MSCPVCMSNGACICYQSIQANFNNQLGIQGQSNQYGQLAISNNQLYTMSQQGMPIPITNGSQFGDFDYELFKKYAHLDDGEIATLFMEETLSSKKEFDQQMDRMMATYKADMQQRENLFFGWCAKYRKSLTKERLDKLKVFL